MYIYHDDVKDSRKLYLIVDDKCYGEVHSLHFSGTTDIGAAKAEMEFVPMDNDNHEVRMADPGGTIVYSCELRISERKTKIKANQGVARAVSTESGDIILSLGDE